MGVCAPEPSMIEPHVRALPRPLSSSRRPRHGWGARWLAAAALVGGCGDGGDGDGADPSGTTGATEASSTMGGTATSAGSSASTNGTTTAGTDSGTGSTSGSTSTAASDTGSATAASTAASDSDATSTAGGTATDTDDPPGAADPCTLPDYDPSGFAAVFDVGPGQPLATPSDVPWESLAPGTLVRIHWREQPYRDKWVIHTQGTAEAPIVVLGVADGGRRPVITGDGANTRAQLDFWSEGRGLVKIGGANQPSGPEAAFITLANLELRDAAATSSFTDAEGNLQPFLQNAAAVFIESGHHITIRNSVIAGSGNGLFSAYASRDVEILCNEIAGNGVPDSIYEHNSYTESLRIRFAWNHYGPLCDTCPGNNLKDRSAGTVIEGNWIEGGNRQLDLVDSDHAEQLDAPEYLQTTVIGNVLVEPDGAGNSQIVHYGGDSGDTARYRAGVLRFAHNTIISRRAGNTTWFRLSSEGEACEASNNVVIATAGSGRLAVSDAAGQVELRHNWLTEGWRPSHGSLTGAVSDEGGNLSGTTPPLLDLAALDLRPQPASALVDAGWAVASELLPAWEFVAPGSARARNDPGAPDIGAYATAP
jgi:hypothetical protein